MKASSIGEIKKELSNLSAKEMLEVCLRLAKYKTENKELISYLLFHAHDEENYITQVKEIMREQIAEMNKSNAYLAKKTIRKVIRTCNKYIKYSKKTKTETELRIYFCQLLKQTGYNFKNNTVICNLYDRQFEKIILSISKLHEDLQSDYTKEIESLNR